MTVKIDLPGCKTPVKIWTDFVENSAEQQLRDLSKLDIIHKHIAVMPDVHAGIGSTVGSVIPTKQAIIPAAVGVDIGCVDKKTEVLTPHGWIKISEWCGQQIMQFNPISHESNFVNPIDYIRRQSDGFFKIKTKYGINQKLSKEHKMLLYKYDSKKCAMTNIYYDILASDFIAAHNRLKLGVKDKFLCTIPNFRTESMCDWDTYKIRLQVAVCADGHIDKQKKCVIRIKKKRKANRLLYLLEKCGIDLLSHSVDKSGCMAFRFSPPSTNKSLTQFYCCDAFQLKIISHEVFKWDGTESGGYQYTSVSKEECDFVQFALACSGYRSTIYHDIRRKKETYKTSKVMDINPFTGLCSTKNNKIEFTASEGEFEYCFTVPCGYFFARRNGCIFATGNCGMSAVQTNLTVEDLPDNLAYIRGAIEDTIPVGFGQYESVSYNPQSTIVTGLKLLLSKHEQLQKRSKKNLLEKTMLQLGTLGGGNHFIEICQDEAGRIWIMLHSGSRGIGNVIGRYFIELAKEDMGIHLKNLPNKDLAYLNEGTQHFQDYMDAVEFAQAYAMDNRVVMMQRIIMLFQQLFGDRFNTISKSAVNCHHNYVSYENHFGDDVYVTRKGAISAKQGQLGIIPGSMGAKSYIVYGLGNEESFHSCSHGAGRTMSRSEAKKKFTTDDLVYSTNGVECRKDRGVLDEIPSAYKDIDEVMAHQDDLVKVEHTLKQLICVKG